MLEQDVPNEQYSIAPVTSDSIIHLAIIITQSKLVGSKEEEGDKYLQRFHKLKPLLFKGAIGPQITEDWLLRIKKFFDSI
ncbi:hypothetical protein IEQ34_003203 [Dendrobium chrysotoxum]|uniref:Uncharacterized protein n=1 Tax=Dendrobium chrysotoxum TaxID=161865 RepID=A0AAV7HLG0_DENCH|nr:hypothetical protein IEQ34_003203 [Dendrobium chrysotoxum]